MKKVKGINRNCVFFDSYLYECQALRCNNSMELREQCPRCKFAKEKKYYCPVFDDDGKIKEVIPKDV